jgi:hypothetical protein
LSLEPSVAQEVLSLREGHAPEVEVGRVDDAAVAVRGELRELGQLAAAAPHFRVTERRHVRSSVFHTGAMSGRARIAMLRAFL